MMDFKSISLKNIDAAKASAGLFLFFQKNVRWFFFAAIFGAILYGGFVWRKCVYNSGWSESKKQEYIKSKDKGAVFNKSAFEGMVAEKERREREAEKKSEGITDIFRLNSNQLPQG
jgi:hypothetical protein